MVTALGKGARLTLYERLSDAGVLGEQTLADRERHVIDRDRIRVPCPPYTVTRR